MRVGLLTTLNTNIGDDFIREGICLVLREVFMGHEVEFVPVNKHQPSTVYTGLHLIHLGRITRYLPRWRYRATGLVERTAKRPKLSRFDSCDLIVQCGTPVLWQHCHRCEWADLIWHQVIGRLSQNIPVLNLAAGSCYPWERQPERIEDEHDAQYLRDILGYCRLTTVRDTLAQSLCASLGVDTPLIPCSAFLAYRNHTNEKSDGRFVFINYMSGGGHYDLDQKIDASRWAETVSELITRLKSRHRLAFLCHNQVEFKLAHDLAPTFPRLWPKNTYEYLELLGKAKVALCNRMHASMVLAGSGIPSVAVCTDTRLLMVDAIELPCFYVKEANTDKLEDSLENLILHRAQERERLLALRLETWRKYIEVTAGAI